MKQGIKILFRILVGIVFFGILFAGMLFYEMNYAIGEVTSSESEDQRYRLVIYMIGEPDWPFGMTHCRFDFIDGRKRIIQYQFDIADDGRMPGESNFEIQWNEEDVLLKVSGDEQADTYYLISFEGKVEDSWEDAESVDTN